MPVPEDVFIGRLGFCKDLQAPARPLISLVMHQIAPTAQSLPFSSSNWHLLIPLLPKLSTFLGLHNALYNQLEKAKISSLT
jgi:hypothetical protein